MRSHALSLVFDTLLFTAGNRARGGQRTVCRGGIEGLRQSAYAGPAHSGDKRGSTGERATIITGYHVHSEYWRGRGPRKLGHGHHKFRWELSGGT
jgi:hypothetical protein